MTHSTAPTLHTNHRVTVVNDAELDTVLDTPLKTVIHVLLPVLTIEIGLRLGEEEWIDATVQVRVLLT